MQFLLFMIPRHCTLVSLHQDAPLSLLMTSAPHLLLIRQMYFLIRAVNGDEPPRTIRIVQLNQGQI